jgi:GH15 family glucan-1,4-alpha-glucosidase
MALWAFYTLGFDWEANDFFYFITDMAEAADGRLQIMYGVDGSAELPESTLDHLSGYDGARPVRIGNEAYEQAQHDVWGAIIGSIYLFVRRRDRLDDRLWKIIVTQVEDALASWRNTDCGMWEVRGAPQHFTSSKVFCWVAADRGARLARIRGDAERAQRWQDAANEIHADVLANALDERGVFTAYYGAAALDASVLLIPLLGFLPADDKRVRETVLAIATELSEDDLVLRYRPEQTDDGFASDEGAFTICSFWLVSSLVMIGELDRAKALCEKLLSYASGLQLYAEEIDPHTGRHLGNFPQAFTHLALINAVMQVIQAEGGQQVSPLA